MSRPIRLPLIRRRSLSPRARRTGAATIGASAAAFFVGASLFASVEALFLTVGPLLGLVLLGCSSVAARRLTGLGAALVAIGLAWPVIGWAWLIVLLVLSSVIAEGTTPTGWNIERVAVAISFVGLYAMLLAAGTLVCIATSSAAVIRGAVLAAAAGPITGAALAPFVGWDAIGWGIAAWLLTLTAGLCRWAGWTADEEVWIKTLTCSQCGYDLRGLRSARCPECGADHDAPDPPEVASPEAAAQHPD